jgi:hypothetical protein
MANGVALREMVAFEKYFCLHGEKHSAGFRTILRASNSNAVIELR